MAGCVESERSKTDGCVSGTHRVEIERVKPDGSVVGPSGKAEERSGAFSCVAVQIASVRCWRG